MDIVALFCLADDFCAGFIPAWEARQLASGERQRCKPGSLTMSETMAITVAFHSSGYRTFKAYYTGFVRVFWRKLFPGLPSYTRFVELLGAVLIPLLAFLQALCGTPTGLSFIDSTTLAVCHNRRIRRHRVFAGLAARGKTSMGWFYGFKLHLVVNDRGELVSFALTPGNVADSHPGTVDRLTGRLTGLLFGDRGYLSQGLFRRLWDRGLKLVTGLRRNMRNRLLPLAEKVLLRKRSIIETINDQLKNIQQVEHTRHRSPANFLVNLVSGLVAYCLQPKKPSLHHEDLAVLTA